MAILIDAYPFLKKKLEAIAEKIKAKKEEEQCDEETRRVIHFVTEGIKKRLGRLDSETAEVLQNYFADIMPAIPREKIMEGVYI